MTHSGEFGPVIVFCPKMPGIDLPSSSLARWIKEHATTSGVAFGYVSSISSSDGMILESASKKLRRCTDTGFWG
jgi:hypothetical protein